MMDERLQFAGGRLAGKPMSELCEEFRISRKTGYKIFDRCPECGVHGMRAPRRARCVRHRTALSFRRASHELWCTEYKGVFLRGKRHYTY